MTKDKTFMFTGKIRSIKKELTTVLTIELPRFTFTDASIVYICYVDKSILLPSLSVDDIVFIESIPIEDMEFSVHVIDIEKLN